MATSKSMKTAAAKFFTASQFAVAGASSNHSKFGHRIFAWYLTKNLPAVPLNPGCASITVREKEYETVGSPSKLSDPKTTSLSVITPPPVTKKLLEEAKESGIQNVWLQPGSFTDEELKYATENFDAAVGGMEGGTVGGEGWCVLVDGDEAIKASGRNDKRNGMGDSDKKKAGPKRQVEKGEKLEKPSSDKVGAESRVSKKRKTKTSTMPTRRSQRLKQEVPV